MGCLAERRGALGGTAQGFWGALLGGEGFADGSCKADAGGGGDTRLSPPALIPPRATFPKSSGWASRASAAACLQPPNSRPNGVRGVCRCVLEGWGGGGSAPADGFGAPRAHPGAARLVGASALLTQRRLCAFLLLRRRRHGRWGRCRIQPGGLQPAWGGTLQPSEGFASFWGDLQPSSGFAAS